jgi:O-6-methylguanine DNA methyltransferase
MAYNDYFYKTFEYLLTVPKGKVVTYGQIAKHLGNKGLARLVGNILHQNPAGDYYPCYKVVNAKGELAKAFVFGGITEQERRLINDGILVEDGKVDLKKYQYKDKNV